MDTPVSSEQPDTQTAPEQQEPHEQAPLPSQAKANHNHDHEPQLSPHAQVANRLAYADIWSDRLSLHLSSPAGLDKSLASICYASQLSSSLLTNISNIPRLHSRSVERRVAHISFIAASSSHPLSIAVLAPTLRARTSQRLVVLATRLKALSAVIADVRVFLRLWGLLGVYRSARQLAASPPRDAVLRWLAVLQVLCGTGYQGLENLAYLASKKVLGWSEERQARAWKWSARFWACSVGLELCRLGWEGRRRRGLRAESVEGEEKLLCDEDVDWWRGWKRAVLCNAAWFPMTLHWSSEAGLLSDLGIGILGCMASGIGLQDLWNSMVLK